jgi:hypothetical protein
MSRVHKWHVEVPGVLSSVEARATAGWIAEVQLPSGMVPWFPGGHGDPWNHVEALMALDVAGFPEEAEQGYSWLLATQHGKERASDGLDGSWYAYYLSVPDGSSGSDIEDPRRETNMCAYVATGVWHHYLATDDRGFLEECFPMVEAAIGFVLRWQRPDGAIIWSVEDDGTPGDHALLTGSSSIYHSLKCALACAGELGLERPRWERAARRLGEALVMRPGAFAPKDEFAMDWYYPVLSGALQGEPARRRLLAGWDTYVMEELGVRCVSDSPWVTAAETAECAMSLLAVGMEDRAMDLLSKIQQLRCEDGAYWTGWVLPQGVSFPGGERSTYTAAAIVLAADMLSEASPASGIFAHLPLEIPPGTAQEGDGLAAMGSLRPLIH